MTEPKQRSLRNQSARALLFLSVILVLLGLIVISPAGRMIFLVLAAVCSAFSALLMRSRSRIFGIVVTIATLLLAGASYPAYKKHMEIYLERSSSSVTQQGNQEYPDDTSVEDEND